MESKIQELTDKIYREGVEKGNDEARRLVKNAQNEALQIVENAKKKADSILAAAKKSSGEMEAHTKSELKLFANQAINALKSEVANLITDKIVHASVQNMLKDKEVMNAFLLSLASQWSANENIVISSSDVESLKAYFQVKAKELLDKGVTIEQVNGQKALFSISPANGAYKVNFGEEEFENYFKSFLRPQLVEMLF